MTNLKRLLNEATPRPWAMNPWKSGSGGTASVCLVGDSEVRSMAAGATPAPEEADAALIAAAVNALPDLLAAVEALEQCIEGFQTVEQWQEARAVLRRVREAVPS